MECVGVVWQCLKKRMTALKVRQTQKGASPEQTKTHSATRSVSGSPSWEGWRLIGDEQTKPAGIEVL
jgi:hypothetical protein